MGHAPRNHRRPGRQPLVHRRGFPRVYKFSPTTLRPLACSASLPAPGCNVSPNVVAQPASWPGPTGRSGSPRAPVATRATGSGPTSLPASGALAPPVPTAPTLCPPRQEPSRAARRHRPRPQRCAVVHRDGPHRIGEITPRPYLPRSSTSSPCPPATTWPGCGLAITSADTIATGPHDLWFTEQGPNAIGSHDGSGVLVSGYVVPNCHLIPRIPRDHRGPDGTMWFTESAANQVARITARQER